MEVSKFTFDPRSALLMPDANSFGKAFNVTFYLQDGSRSNTQLSWVSALFETYIYSKVRINYSIDSVK